MTLLIVFLSVTNIVVGYALAIYLGHARPYWETGSSKAPSTGSDQTEAEARSIPQEAVGSVKREPAVEPTKTEYEVAATPTVKDGTPAVAEAPTTQLAGEEMTADTNPSVAKEIASEQEAEPEPVAEATADKLEVTSKKKAGDMAEETETAEAEEATPEEKTLNDLEAFREQIHEQPDPPTIEEELSSVESSQVEDTPESKLENKPSTESPDVSAEAPEALAEDFLEGISDFQEQLKKQQELSKISAVEK